MEKNCKWHFKLEGGRDVGPNDPVDEKFKGQPYYSIVREAIQNSLDAIENENEPVKVDFSFFDLNRNDYPEFFDIETHINQCNSYYSGNDNAQRLFEQMLYYLNGDIEGKKRVNLSCMRISDYNTVGMSYEESDTKSPFYAFLRAGGVSAKGQGAGGSFGFGKGAYYTLSPIKTIVVSTKTDSEEVFFEGSTILTTHKNEFDEKLTAYGYYDNNDGEPTDNEDEIPEIFRRKEKGTDVNIIGLWDERHRKTIMVKSVLNNFWLAIHDNKLIAQIDDVIINRDNLSQIMDNYFEGQYESGAPTEIEAWNPKSYFKAVKYAETSDQFRVFEDTLETLGDVKLYVYLEKGLPNRTAYFRKPKMVVFKRTNRKVIGYSAVFVCENERGNEILRLMENPAHNEWQKENHPKKEGKIDKDARKAENEISSFINRKLEELSKVKTGKKAVFLGLEEYLSIPEDLAEKEEEYDFEGNNHNTAFGKETKEATEDETGMQSTDNEPVKIKPTLKSHSEVKEIDDIEQSEEGSEKTTSGGENKGDGGDQSGEGDSEGATGDRSEDNSTKTKVFINVGFRSFAQKENNNLYHILVIKVDRQIENAELELLVGSDNGRDEGIGIKNCDLGISEKNIIKNVKLETGINKIKLQFVDNLAHSVKLKAYEIQ